MKNSLIIFLCFICFIVELNAQQNSGVSDKLVLAESMIPGLSENVDLSVNEMLLKDLLYSIGASSGINLVADEQLQQKVSGNFRKLKVSELLLFLAERYSLDLKISGSVLTFFQRVPPVAKEKSRKIYVHDNGKIDLEINADTLGHVLRSLSSETGVNFHFENQLYKLPVTAYVREGSLNTVISAIAASAGLRYSQIDTLLFRFERRGSELTTQVPQVNNNQTRISNSSPEITASGAGIQISAFQSDLHEIIKSAGGYFRSHYILSDEIKGQVTIVGKFESFTGLLSALLVNTSYGYSEQDGLVLIGLRQNEALRKMKVYEFRERTLTGVLDIIPSDLKKGLEIRPFPDLNAVLLCGSETAIRDVSEFLKSVDRKVPVVDIEVYIVDVRDSKNINAGIQTGLQSGITETSGSAFPAADIELNSVSVNEIMSWITRLGLVSLGRVGPAFYLKLKLLEEQGILKIRSTPRLATLNGHEANLSIGRTEYYLEVQNNVIGTQNPQNLISQQYKSVNADLALTINPSVSENEDITLDIKVRQSNFTERISPNAPPGTISRDFSSLVRVRNGEMVVLGGLEEDTRSESARGLPLLSRIPVIKWLFGMRSKGRAKNKLTIFIRPTVNFN